MELIIGLFIAGIFAAGVWADANNRGRKDGALYAVLTFLLCFIGLPLYILSVMMDPGGKKCSSCAETVKTEATVCKHCGTKFA